MRLTVIVSVLAVSSTLAACAGSGELTMAAKTVRTTAHAQTFRGVVQLSEPARARAASASKAAGPCIRTACVVGREKQATSRGAAHCLHGARRHAGGLSNGCPDRADRPSERSASFALSAATASPPVRSSSSTSTQGAGNTLPVHCWGKASTGDFLAASSETTCAFANNAFYEYYKASGGHPTRPESVSVWSAANQQYRPLKCYLRVSVVNCIALNGETVRFTRDAITTYSSSLAAAYSASGLLGPNK